MQVPEPIHDLTVSLPEGRTRKILQLRAMGNLDLCRNSAGRVAIIGSRRASWKSLEVANAITAKLVTHSVTIVSGGAAGIDMAGHTAALANGGNTVIVLPQGLATWRPPAELAVWDWDRGLVVSQFEDEAPWSARHAHQRNNMIAQLSDAVVAVAAELKSGSMNMILETLRMKKPLFVPAYQAHEMPAGILRAIANGASTIYQTKSGPNLRELLTTIDSEVCV